MKVLKRIQYQEQAGMKIFTTPNTRISVRGEFKSWIPDGCDLVSPTLTMAMVQMKLLNLLPISFFLVQSRRQPEELLPWQPVQSSSAKL